MPLNHLSSYNIEFSAGDYPNYDITFSGSISPEERTFFERMFQGGCDKVEVPKVGHAEGKVPTAAPKNNTMLRFSDPATILWINGKKYVSKVHNEPFDEEKGLLMCLAKANGITHKDIQKMLKAAQRQPKKAKEKND